MKITMYELLGMIRNGNPPKKIKISELTYTFNDMCQSYYDEDGNELTDNIHLLRNLDEPVEIIEEKKIPEKLKVIKDNSMNCLFLIDKERKHHNITTEDAIIVNKINETIDYLKYLKSKEDE